MDPKQILRLLSGLVLLDHDFPQVNPDPQPHPVIARLPSLPLAVLEQQRESDRRRRLAEQQQERIAGRLDFLALRELTEQLAHEEAVPLQECGPGAIAQSLPELRGPSTMLIA